MIQPVLVSTLLLSTAIALISPPARALCIDEDNFSIERDDEESFVSDSPATAETNFRFEVDLSNLTSSGGSDEAEAMPSEGAPTEAEPMANIESGEEPVAMPPAVAEFDSASTSDAAILGIMGTDEEPTVISREEYLDQRAEDLNECL